MLGSTKTVHRRWDLRGGYHLIFPGGRCRRAEAHLSRCSVAALNATLYAPETAPERIPPQKISNPAYASFDSFGFHFFVRWRRSASSRFQSGDSLLATEAKAAKSSQAIAYPAGTDSEALSKKPDQGMFHGDSLSGGTISVKKANIRRNAIKIPPIVIQPLRASLKPDSMTPVSDRQADSYENSRSTSRFILGSSHSGRNSGRHSMLPLYLRSRVLYLLPVIFQAFRYSVGAFRHRDQLQPGHRIPF